METKRNAKKGKPFHKGKKSEFVAKSEKFPKQEKETKPYIGPNDIAWRTNDETLTELVAHLPFGLAAGLSQTGYTYGGNLTYVQPGIMRILTKITAGNSNNYISALNLVVRKIYSFVRHANSGSRNYEAADLGIYFISIGQVLGLLGYLQRVYAVALMYSSTNRYTPSALLNAMGVIAGSVQPDLAKLKYVIAWLGRVIGSLAFPDIPYFHACYEAYKYIYVDNDSPKEQYYLLTPEVFAIYNPTYDSNGGGVEYTRGSNNQWIIPNSVTAMNIDGLYNYAKELTDVLLGDEDIGIISGDILKAFPNGTGLFKPEAFGDYEVFQHSQEFLQQVHNLTVVPAEFDINASAKIVFKGYNQDPGSANLAPFIKLDVPTLRPYTVMGSKYDFCRNLMIDAFSRVPDAKEVVNCTVLNPQLSYTAGSGTNDVVADLTKFSFDLFLPVRAEVISYTTSGTLSYIDVTTILDKTNFVSASLSVNQHVITAFDWHPFVIAFSSSSLAPLGDMQNMRIFPFQIGEKIHDNSMLNLFAFKELDFIRK